MAAGRPMAGTEKSASGQSFGNGVCYQPRESELEQPLPNDQPVKIDTSESRHKLLIVDDDPELLRMYRDMLAQLPSQPEIHTAQSGARAMALLESEQFRLLICDLKMPKMDGLQVLSIVRRKHPGLRTVALTAEKDEQFRTRAYALGVDLFWQKPASEQEIRMFLECLESLLGPEAGGGFRGVQSKSLVDIIQLECLSQSSSVLRITNGLLTGKIWIQDGEVIDAEAGDFTGEAAFNKILGWKAGNFETLPAEAERSRGILKSYSALLLESAQAFDESQGVEANGGARPAAAVAVGEACRLDGVEFVLMMGSGEGSQPVGHGLENPERMTAWARRTLHEFGLLGEKLNAGPLESVDGVGPQRHVGLAQQGTQQFCVGYHASVQVEQMRERMRKVVEICAC
jgi:CheY-like chemotaxis protein